MKKTEYRVIIGYEEEDFPFDLIKCPVCGFEYVHHESRVFIRDGKDNYKGHTNVRGNVIVIPMHCENHCKFKLFIGFHKGSCRVWAEDYSS